MAVLWTPFCIGCQEVADRGNTSVVEHAYRLDVNAAYSAAARNVADGGAHMSNHRSAVEKSPSAPVPREGQMALGRKRMNTRPWQRISGENCA